MSDLSTVPASTAIPGPPPDTTPPPAPPAPPITIPKWFWWTLVVVGTLMAAGLTWVLWPANQPPVSAPTASVTAGEAPLLVSFTGNASDPDGEISSYVWEFGDGQADTSGDAASHVYGAGSYIASLTVTDDDGAVTTSTVSITVTEPPPPPPPAIVYPTTTVKRFGTLYGIAYRLCGGDGSRWTEIQALNGNVDPHKIHYGDVLNIPLDCTSDLPSLPINKVTYYTVASADPQPKQELAPSTGLASVQGEQLKQAHSQSDSVVASALAIDCGHQLTVVVPRVVTAPSLKLVVIEVVDGFVPVSSFTGAAFPAHWYETTG